MAKVSDNTATKELISPEALEHLKYYKYSSVDKSPISYYILRHYWNWFVELLPLWLAPNLVTLLGFFFILGNVALLLVYVPDLVGPAPSWVYISFAIGIWMYSTMDNVDGKQARRTGTSSPLGELFDHGIDSLNCTLASLFEVAAMGFGPTRTGAFTAMVPCLLMFFSTWETYHTHTLYLGYFNGPTEGLLGACLFMITSAIYGPGIWSAPIYPHLPSLLQNLYPSEGTLAADYFHPDSSVKDIWVIFILTAFLIAHVPECVSNVYRSQSEKGLRTLPLLKEWTPMALFTGGCIAWLGSPYSSLLRKNHLVLFSLTMSFVFGRMTTKIILAHLTHQPFPYWTILLTPLLAGGIISNLPALGIPTWTDDQELWFLWAYFFFSAIVYGRWAYIVITAICNFLGINALTIPEEKILEAQQKREAENRGERNGAAGSEPASVQTSTRRNERATNGTPLRKAD